MVILIDTKTNQLLNIKPIKMKGVGTTVATTIMEKRIMERAMGPNTMTTLTKLSTMMMKIFSMILRMMVKATPISTRLTLILEIEVQRQIIRLKNIDPRVTTMIEVNRKEDAEDMKKEDAEDMKKEEEEAEELEVGAEEIKEAVAEAMIVISEVEEEETIKSMPMPNTPTIEMIRKKM